ncbi:MAG TPA: DUF6691 family protein [Ignavibacteriaceae bacterium]|nr:DUF6691 family protein [Ignavibacteriaceae bacterium]
MIGPLVKNGIISDGVNTLFAVLIGMLFGYALQRSGFTNSKKIAGAFYMKDVDVPVVMFTAITTASIGLWGLSLLGLIDLGKFYFLPSYLLPMVVGGLIFGVGMAMGGFCPGTSIAAMVTGKIDAMVFVGGFLLGSLLFGDLYPLWDKFYNSGANGVWRIDQLFNINVGFAILLVALLAVFGSLGMRKLQYKFWGKND